ncbi:tetratricopeptide repeat protein [Croceicoccus mobilis]|uniref:Tetratricopeptide repeat protein n=1 Tax=Croceicoccus mobilis TaxID=1703339 RepID=A0A917DRQ4_9SPHN|nr:tetratricopeptide repeat protein [Croceicoccus mobilis]GGD63676.1 hypothetical protein GCM10010990_11460 [Croceicoccus mobilis]
MVRSISRAALAFALATGMAATGVSVTPAMAQGKKKEKEAAAEYSKEFVEAYQPLANAVDAGGDLAALKPQIPSLVALTTSNDEKMAAGNVIFNIGSKTQDQAVQLQGVEMMLASGKVPAENIASFSLAAGQLAYNAKDYTKAETYLKQAADAGSADAKGLLASTYITNEKPAEGLAMLDSAIKDLQAAGQPVPEGWAFNGMAAAVGQDDRPAAFKWGVMTLATDSRDSARSQAYRVVEAYSPFADDVQLDLMRLMARENAFDQPRQYVAYLDLMQPLRRPGEAKNFFDGVGAKAPTDNALVADAKRVANERYATTLKELDADAPSASGDAALAIADTYLGYGKSAEAEAAYTKAIDGGTTEQDRALTGLGIAQADQGKYAEAKATFEKITTGQRSELAKLWIAYVDGKAGA